MKYQKKPSVIYAIQYTAPIYSNIRDFIESFGDNPNDVIIKVWDNPNEDKNISNTSGTSHLAIKTLEGNMKINHGDWIIRGVKGEYYPCKPDIFKLTYDDHRPQVSVSVCLKCGKDDLLFSLSETEEGCARCNTTQLVNSQASKDARIKELEKEINKINLLNKRYSNFRHEVLEIPDELIKQIDDKYFPF